MTKNLNDFISAADDANHKAAITGIETIESVCRRLRIVLRGGVYRAAQRVTLLRELQDGVGLLISAEGRQTLVEDVRANSHLINPVPPRTKENLQQAVVDAALELTKYTEDEDGSHDYYTGEEEVDHEDEDEDSDDPAPAVPGSPLSPLTFFPGALEPFVVTPPPKSFGVFIKHSNSEGPRSGSYPRSLPSRAAAENYLRYGIPAESPPLPVECYEVREII